jgi:hypothetical protein
MFPSFTEFQSPETDVSEENFLKGTMADNCLSFAHMLGLDAPVEEKVLTAAIQDAGYAKKLFASRGTPQLAGLLNHPPENLYRSADFFSNGGLVAKAGKAIFSWALAGFPTVSAVTLKKREDACLACPELVNSSRMLQLISASSKVSEKTGDRTGNKSCAICGCVVKNKIRLVTETCPKETGDTPGINRWGEVIPENKNQVA